MRFYCNVFAWPLTMSARHPVGDGDRGSISTLMPFYDMALAGDPNDSTKEYDAEMAGAFLRLQQYKKSPFAQPLLDAGYRAEPSPNGNLLMNYACTMSHRRKEWLANVGGHSRYLWGNETYVANNLYGRYVAYGNLQLLSNGTPVCNRASGYVQEGWNWNFWPGTTAVELPMEALRARVCNVDRYSGYEEMLISDQSFAGGVNMEGENGVFAMKLHSHAKYDATQWANKSYFFFNDKIVCIGTGIRNQNSAGKTYTTLFQTYLERESDPITVDGETVTGLCYENVTDTVSFLRDNCGNAYYVPGRQKLCITRMRQISRDQNTDQPTANNFARALIDHGAMPENASYEYCVFPHAEATMLTPQAAKASYTVLCKGETLHCVRDAESGTYAYVAYAPQAQLDFSQVLSICDAMLVMEKRTAENALCLCLCDPDLRLYEGQEPDQRNEDGTQREVSLYSRKWLKADSIPKTISLTLRGKWTPAQPQEGITVQPEGENTRVSVVSVFARSYTVKLEAAPARGEGR